MKTFSLLAACAFGAALGCGSDAPADTANPDDGSVAGQSGGRGAAGTEGGAGSISGNHDASSTATDVTGGTGGSVTFFEASAADVALEATGEGASADATMNSDAPDDDVTRADAATIADDATNADATTSADAASDATSDAGTDAMVIGFQPDSDAIYISISDAASADDATCGLGPMDSGQGNHPCLSITYGLGRATSTNRSKALVADGTYGEAVTLVDGKSMYGGYRPDTWERHLATTVTVIQGVATVGAHDRTVVAANIASATVFEGFVVRGSANAKSSGNSYAIYVTGSSGNLTLRNNVIFAGRGGPGDAGAPGPNGTPGADGAAYTTALDSLTTTGTGKCDAANNRTASGAGARTCPGADDVGGGNGGGNNCTPSRGTQTSTAMSPAAAGQPGAGAGGGVGGATGVRGYDAELNGGTCMLPTNGAADVLPMFGSDGKTGGQGGNAGGVAGCSMAAGTVVSGDWTGFTAAVGNTGSNGGGGGGGAAGGGSACTTNGTCKDLLGGHGGGGATGGCGGNGGGGGHVGGGAFGIFLIGNAAPLIIGNTISLGDGGPGGGGGIGGAGGLGGVGTQGGQTVALFCTGKGGRGGDGGAGGVGSGGGGGCGGASFGIYTSGLGTPNYCTLGTNIFSGGLGGEAGQGGFSGGNSGGDGAVGALANCSYN